MSPHLQHLRLPIDVGVGGPVALTGMWHQSSAYLRDERLSHSTDVDVAVAAEGIKAILGVPLKVSGNLIGILFAAHRSQRTFTAIIFRGGGLEELAAALYDVLVIPAVILDADGELRASVGFPQGPESLPRVPPRDPEAGTPQTDREGEWTVIPIDAVHDLLGVLALSHPAPLSDVNGRIAARAATVAALLLSWRRSVAETSDRDRRAFLIEVASRPPGVKPAHLPSVNFANPPDGGDVPGQATSPETVTHALALIAEAFRCLEEGVATAESIDEIARSTFGIRLGEFGPIRLADMGGLDTYASILTYLAQTLGERFAVPALLQELSERGDVGVKSGQGFFSYADGEGAALSFARDAALARRLDNGGQPANGPATSTSRQETSQ
ncbi:hypothetical protein GCM10022222_39520 [Amycolatopsis ultiminotia]|uniref:3-hydroxyacyl-CoA dehydrogenase C-terminal domain-containing protein n=1 Tax=Amycolatopsis ultiminotia TaxID=543629 RepID=A0ABP6WLK0_9PSEU